MSSLPSSGTMLPPAVRYAKIIGTVGSGIIAGMYFTHSRHTIPALLESSAPADRLVKSFKNIKAKTDRPVLYTLLVSTSSLAYASYYLYYNPPTDQGVSTTTFSSRSFLPSTTTEYPTGYEWAMYGASTLLLTIVVPYTKLILNKAQQSLLAAAESVEESEKRKMNVQVVDDGKVKSDLEEWISKSFVRAGLAGAATLISVIALAG